MPSQSQKIVVVGAGGLGREVHQYVGECNTAEIQREVIGFIDDNSKLSERWDFPCPYLGPIDAFAFTAQTRFAVAIAEPRVRRAVVGRLLARGARFATIVHPLAYLSAGVEVGEGVLICPFAFIGPRAKLEDFVILNTHASFGHDARVGKFSVLSPYSVINGNVTLEEGVFMGTHATVTPGKRIGAYSKIAAGSIVTHDVGRCSLAVGNPAKAREIFAYPQ